MLKMQTYHEVPVGGTRGVIVEYEEDLEYDVQGALEANLKDDAKPGDVVAEVDGLPIVLVEWVR